MKKSQPRKWPKPTRDGVLFVGGLAGITYEYLLHEGEPRQAWLIFFGGMIGLPAFLRSDEARKGRKNGNDEDD